MQTDHTKTAVIILNYNGKKYLKKFLPDLIKHTANADIIVADNNSSDDSVFFLKEHYPDITLIENEENGGFAKGYNDALQYVNADYYLLLNSDIEVTPGWLDPLVNHMDKHPNTAACQPKIRSFHHKDKFEYAGAAGGYIDKYGYPFCRGRIFDHLETDHGQYEDEKEVFWATGACMMVRASVFHQLGGLDADFFAHMEEIDFCWRCKNQGYSIKYIPTSTVYHVGGGTLPKNSPFKTYLNFRNNISLLYKNMAEPEFRKLSRIRWFLDMLAALKFLLSGQIKDTTAIFKAHRHFRRDKLKHAAKKLPVKQRSKQGIYHGSIVKDYYLKGKKTFRDLDFKA